MHFGIFTLSFGTARNAREHMQRLFAIITILNVWIDQHRQVYTYAGTCSHFAPLRGCDDIPAYILNPYAPSSYIRDRMQDHERDKLLHWALDLSGKALAELAAELGVSTMDLRRHYFSPYSTRVNIKDGVNRFIIATLERHVSNIDTAEASHAETN